MPELRRPPIALALYRDPKQLLCIERPGFAGRPPSVIVELSLQTGLRSLIERTGPGAIPQLAAPLIFAPTWRRTVRSLLQLAAEAHPDAAGPVMLVCHTRDAPSFVDTLGPVDLTRLIWHPTDAADHRLAELIARIKRSRLAPSLARGGLYVSSAGRLPSAAEWQRTAVCPVLDGLNRVARTPPALRVLAGA